MNAEQIHDSLAPRQGRLCPWQCVCHFDNFLRPLIHDPRKLFGPYVQCGMTVLDVGCGGGFVSLALARMVGEEGLVISADVQPEMLEMVRERAMRAGLFHKIRTHRCEPSRIGVREALDFVVAFYMVHEVPESRAFLKEVYARLKPGGRLFIAEPKVHVSYNHFMHTVQEAQQVGFIVLETPHVCLSRAVVLTKEV